MYKGALLPVELLLCGPYQTGMQGFYIFIGTGRDFKGCYLCLGDSLYARPGKMGHKMSNQWKYGILLAAEEVVRAGVLSYAPGSESVNSFTCLTFHRLVRFGWFVFGVGAVFLLWCCFPFVL